jgi:hypothetical protein
MGAKFSSETFVPTYYLEDNHRRPRRREKAKSYKLQKFSYVSIDDCSDRFV